MIEKSYLVNGFTLNTYQTDGDKPPILLVHGYTDSALCWQTLIDALAPRFTVFAYDSRGHGKSSRVTSDYTVHDLAQECAGLISQLGVGRMGLIGHSMGAATALGVCALASEWVNWAILEDPPLYAEVNSNLRDMSQWKQGVATLQNTPRDMVVAYYRENDYKAWREADLQPRVDARMELDLAVFDHMRWDLSPHWSHYTQNLPMRGLLITGEVALGGIVTPSVASELCAQWSLCESVHVEGVGHHIRCGAPETYLAILNRFFEQA